ncbi:MAG: TetR/AcrR family transcriptional regulator [Duncaniella sp.]|nr:TetR/AcrR family transcriptional regulator [Duncaniella sp.]
MPTSAIAAKTRERLLDVARQLFASNGVERTTMNDIAAASDKGRRTIYTYFKNKKEIYDAVIERDAEAIVSRLRNVVDSDLEPLAKLRNYLEVRFDIVTDTLKASSISSEILSYLTFDRVRLERIRLLAVEKERHLFARLIDEGVALGAFDPINSKALPSIHQVIFQGVDYTHVRGNFDELGLTPASIRQDVIEFMCAHVQPKSSATSSIKSE